MKQISENFKIDVQNRTEFNLFEACVLWVTHKWDDKFTIDDEFYHHRDWVTTTDRKNRFPFKFHIDEWKDFLEKADFHYDEYSIQDIMSTLNSDYYSSDNFRMDTGHEDWNEGRVLEAFDEETYSEMLMYLSLRSPHTYATIEHLSKQEQIEKLLEFFDVDKNKYDVDLVSDLTYEYASAEAEAYSAGFRDAIKKEYEVNLIPYGVKTGIFLESYNISPEKFIQSIYKHKLPRDMTFAHYLKFCYDKEKINLDYDVNDDRWNHWSESDFNYQFHGSCRRLIKNKISSLDENEVEKSEIVINNINRLGKFGIKIGDTELTPDKKFKFLVNKVDIDGNFHVSLYDIDSNKSSHGVMSVEGIINLKTTGTLFDANEMLNEEEVSLPYMSDRMRASYIEQGFTKEISNQEIELDDLYDADDTDLVVTRKINDSTLEYNEMWVESCIEGLRSKPEYANLKLSDAFDKFIRERFSLICKKLGCQIKSVEFTKHENYDDMEYDWWMKVIIEKEVINENINRETTLDDKID